MKLPNADEAIVPRHKLENYLLDLAHPIGGGKARFSCHSASGGKNGTCWLMPFESTRRRILSRIRSPMLKA
jgi:hypothetical protein